MSVSDYMKFLNTMEEATGEKPRLYNLRKQLLAKARPVPKAGVRVLEEAYNDDAYGDDAYGDDSVNGDDAVAYTDDSVATDDQAVANDDQASQYGNDGTYMNSDSLDLSNFSLKYVGCQAVNTWSDNMAQDEGANSVFALERFVVLRLCPSTWCSKYRKYGCGSNYGDYMILMEDYLAIMKQYHHARVSHAIYIV